jgi:glyoxylase-like metal-dependent hydrolase (beta-lactamase superfamily II)
VAADTNGYLLVRDAAALLIDCPLADVATALRDAGLPAPEVVLHTQVQAEHCGEWAAFPDAGVYVNVESEPVARRSSAFFAACDTVWPPDRAWDTLGAEPYGIAGCTTERPPAQSLNVADTLVPGTPFRWRGVELDVLPLSASGKRSIGFGWREPGVVFTGDLLAAGGTLVNAYDLERSYGMPTGYLQLRRALNLVEGLDARLLLPTTCELITDPAGDIATLRARVAWVTQAPARRTDEPGAPINYTPARTFGRFRQVAEGIFQNTNFGNVVVFIAPDGGAVMVDPGPCIWPTWEEGVAGMQEDLDLLEREAGLRRVELALLTHHHGDHVQFCDLLRARYGTEICATPDVAMLIAEPETFRYPCTLDWYAFPFARITVDRVLPFDAPLAWRDTTITPMHTPGHCYAHAAFSIPWRGLRTVCTGDVLQYGAGPISVGMPILYNDTAWPSRGMLPTYRRLADERADLVLCGHSQSFFDPDGGILADWAAMAEASQALAQAMLGDDLERAMTPPGFDEKRARVPVLV